MRCSSSSPATSTAARFELLVLGHESDGPQTATLAARAGLRLIPAPYSAGTPAPSRLRALRSLYRAEGIDLLHFHSPAAGGQLVPALAARLAGVRASIATYHQVQPWLLPPRSRALNRITHTRLIDHTLAVSEGVRQTLDARTGVPAGRVQVLHNGIDPVPAATPEVAPALPWREPGTVLLGCFGRLSPEKGLPVVLQAMALLLERCPQARLLIAGDGPQRGELEALTDSLGLAGRVHFLGFREDARALMGAVDVVVHAPAYEGFGLVVLEAMAAGKPVVVNDAPGGIDGDRAGGGDGAGGAPGLGPRPGGRPAASGGRPAGAGAPGPAGGAALPDALHRRPDGRRRGRALRALPGAGPAAGFQPCLNRDHLRAAISAT